MATTNIVPRANNEGSLGTASKQWNTVRTKDLYLDGIKFSGNGATKTTLWSGAAYTVNDTLNLSDDYLNYDYILLTLGDGSEFAGATTLIDTKTQCGGYASIYRQANNFCRSVLVEFASSVGISSTTATIISADNLTSSWALVRIDGIKFKSGGGSSSSSNTYSTTEQRIGTWIDGKPLYQITFNNPTLPLNTGLISTNYTVRHIDGMAHDTDTILKLPHVDYIGGNIYIYDGIFTPSTGVFTIRQTNMSSAVLDYITLQYTKITD